MRGWAALFAIAASGCGLLLDLDPGAGADDGSAGSVLDASAAATDASSDDADARTGAGDARAAADGSRGTTDGSSGIVDASRTCAAPAPGLAATCGGLDLVAIPIAEGSCVTSSTCGGSGVTTLSCNASDTSERLFLVREPADGTMTLIADEGFTIALVETGCFAVDPDSCPTSNYTVTVTSDWLVAVERIGGGCGEFTFSVE